MMAKAKGTTKTAPKKNAQLLPRYRYVLLDKQGHIAVIRLSAQKGVRHGHVVPRTCDSNR